MINEVQALIHYLQYHDQKYIKPEKALDEEEYMLQFKADGAKARKTFMSLVDAINERVDYLEKQRVSNWMNQAQIGRALFYCFFRGKGDLPSQPGIALRLYEASGRLGITWEVSVLERTLDKTSLALQHKVLSQPLAESFYYLIYRNNEPIIYPPTEDNRLALAQAVADGTVRKVLVKGLIGYFDEYDSQTTFINDAIAKLAQIYPYYLLTRPN